MISVTVDIKGPTAMINTLTKNLSQPGFRTWITTKVTPYVREQAEETFDGEGGRVGGWEPLKESTWERKSSARMLVETGALKKEVTSVKENFPGNFTAEWGGDSKVYKAHQTGFRHNRSGKKVPARKMLAWTNQDADFIRNTLEYHIMQNV